MSSQTLLVSSSVRQETVPTMEGQLEDTPPVIEEDVACRGEEGDRKTALPSESQQPMHKGILYMGIVLTNKVLCMTCYCFYTQHT